MNVAFDGKVYTNFEKNPKARSQWAEALVKNAIETKMGFPTFSTEDLRNRRVKLDKAIRSCVDSVFKNREMYSIDLFFINENKSKRKQRKTDQRFVDEIITSKKPYNFGKFLEKRQYHLLFQYGKSGKRLRASLVPMIFFVEVKSNLRDSKSPIISTTEAYKLNYALKQYRIPIVISLVVIDLEAKTAEIGLILVKKFKGIGDKWMKIVPPKNGRFPRISVSDLPEPARNPLPVLLPKGGNEVVNVQFLNSKDEIEIVGIQVFADKVQITETNPV